LAGLKTPKKAARIKAPGGQSLLRNGREAQRIACHKVMLENDFVNGADPGQWSRVEPTAAKFGTLADD
jgi:hypothetical protein